MLGVTGEDFHLITAFQFVAERHQLVVHLGTDTMATQESVNLEGKVESRTTGGHGLDFTLRCENEDFGSEEVELDGVEEVHGIGLWIVEDFLDGGEPVAQFSLVLSYLFSLLVFPMGGKSLFGHFVHALRTDLNLYPPAFARHQCDMERLIAVGFGVVEPFPQTVGMTLINLSECHVDVETLIDFVRFLCGSEDDAHGQDVVDLIESDMLGLHLVPDRVWAFHALDDAVAESHLVECLLNRGDKVGKEFIAFAGCLCQL